MTVGSLVDVILLQAEMEADEPGDKYMGDEVAAVTNAVLSQVTIDACVYVSWILPLYLSIYKILLSRIQTLQ